MKVLKFCPSCKLDFDDKFSFCDKCGNKLEIKEERPVCPNCGRALSIDAEACSFCGIKLKIPFINNNWFGFKGRTTRLSFIKKITTLQLIPLFLGIFIAYFASKPDFIYYCLDFMDVAKKQLPFLFLLGIGALFVCLLQLGLFIRRCRDIGVSVKYLIVFLACITVLGVLFSDYSIYFSLAGMLPIIYLSFADGEYDDSSGYDLSSVMRGNDTKIEKRSYLCLGVVIASLLFGGYTSLKMNTFANTYGNPNSGYIFGDRLFLLKAPFLEKNQYLKASSFNNKWCRIIDDDDGTRVDFIVLVDKGHPNSKLNFYQHDSKYDIIERKVINNAEELEEFNKRVFELAKGLHVTKEKVKLVQDWNTENINGTYADTLYFILDGKHVKIYDFYHMNDRYRFLTTFGSSISAKKQEYINNLIYSVIWNSRWKDKIENN